MTPLDRLCEIAFHDADDVTRARILQKLADTELFVALDAEPSEDQARMRQFDLPLGPVVLACDLDDRLSGFFGAPAPYAAMPGRVLAALLAGQGVGLLVNPDAKSEILLTPDMLHWLVEGLSSALPDRAAVPAPARLTPPSPAMIATLAEPLAERLANLRGHVAAMALVGADWPDGRSGHLVSLSGVAPDDRPAVAKSLAEMLAFLPPVEGGLDIGFDLPDLPDAAFTLTAGVPGCGCGGDHAGDPAPAAGPKRPRAPGMDPQRPPILRF